MENQRSIPKLHARCQTYDHLTQEELIDGLVGAWSEELTAAGFANYNPDAPVPKGECLPLSDEVSDEETKEINDKGYEAVCGSLIWV